MRVRARAGTPVDERPSGPGPGHGEGATCSDCSHFKPFGVRCRACDGWCGSWRALPTGKSLLVSGSLPACPLFRIDGTGVTKRHANMKGAR